MQLRGLVVSLDRKQWFTAVESLMLINNAVEYIDKWEVLKGVVFEVK